MTDRRVHFSDTAAEAAVDAAADSLNQLAIGTDAARADMRADTPRMPQNMPSTMPSTMPQSMPPVTPETEAKAKEFIEQVGATEEDREGLRSLQNLTLSMGLPTARACFRAMLEANSASAAVRAWATREIAAFSPVTEVGCMQVDYFDKTAGRPATAHLVLDECPRDHDLGAQLARLRSRVNEEKWVEVIKHVSMLVHLGRSIYAQIAERSKPLIRRIYGRPADHDCAAEMQLGVDSRNTTLFVDPRWPTRVGIFVHINGAADE